MKKIWKDSNDHLLGTMSDMKLSSKLGVDYAIIQRQRILKGVPAYRTTIPSAMERHLDALSGYTDDQLRLPLKALPAGVRPYVGIERKRRGLSRWEAALSFKVAPATMQQAMVKAAYTLKPRPTLQAIGDALHISRQRIKQIVDSLVGTAK